MKVLSFFATAAALWLGTTAPVFAEPAYPAKSVTIVAAYPPGGTVDLLSRVLSQKLGEEWKQTDSFGRDDLPLLAKVIDLAHTWIFEQSV